MRALAERYPDDPDAQTFYAEALLIPVRWQWYGRTASRPTESRKPSTCWKACCGAIRSIPARIISTSTRWNRRPTPERGVPSAQRLMGIVPSAGHMVHMPGHIWLVLGDYDHSGDGERARHRSRPGVLRADRRHRQLHHVLPAQSALPAVRAMMQGRVAETRKATAQMMTRCCRCAPMPCRRWRTCFSVTSHKCGCRLGTIYWRRAPAESLSRRRRSGAMRGRWHCWRGETPRGAAREQAAFESARKRSRRTPVGERTRPAT